MRAYGLQYPDQLTYPEGGAPSKERKMKGKNRHIARRRMHKHARNQNKKIIKQEISDHGS